MMKYKLMARLAALLDRIIWEHPEFVETTKLQKGMKRKRFVFENYHKAADIVGPRRYDITVTRPYAPVTETTRYELTGNGFRPHRGAYALTKHQLKNTSNPETISAPISLKTLGEGDRNLNLITTYLLYRRTRRLRNRVLGAFH